VSEQLKECKVPLALSVASNVVGLSVESCDTVAVEHDYPYEAILNTARKQKCDLIAMASHGRRGLSAVVLGSETQKVLTHSTIPVLVYR
jgi:nucleotide-binding universal stress UspA family protein